MPRLLDSESRTEVLVDCMNDVLVREGISALTLRRIANVSGVSTSSILHHFGCREHLFRVAAWRCGRARLDDIRIRTYAEGVGAFLPGTDDQLARDTAWHAWIQLARCEPAWQNVVAEVLGHERGLLAVQLGLPFDDDRTISVMSLVHGLIAAMGYPANKRSLGDARRALDASVPGIVGAQPT